MCLSVNNYMPLKSSNKLNDNIFDLYVKQIFCEHKISFARQPLCM